MNKAKELIESIESFSGVMEISEMIKNKVNQLNRKRARGFHLGQTLEFKIGETYKGTVANIGNTGKIKVKLIGHWKYDSYTIGAAELSEKLI